jgi:hypothetical protein
MQPQVQILTQCPQCNGEAYLPDLLVTCDDGSKRLTYTACLDCGGSGRQKIWIALTDLLEMLAELYQCDPLQPDWLALSQEKPVSAYQDSREAAGV